MTAAPHIVLLHAYSTRNSGDGLLVDLSVALLQEAFGPDVRVSIVAADPGSFGAHAHVYPAPVLAQQGWRRLATAASALLPPAMAGVNAELHTLYRLLDSADLIVGVGGGYLRSRSATEILKLHAGHLVQLRAARASGKPAVYLPQSIGPVLPQGPLAGHLAPLLAGLSAVFVRDDRSAEFLRDNVNTQRAADLAVLDFANRGEHILREAARATRSHMAHVALVLRAAPNWSQTQHERYLNATNALRQTLSASCRLSIALQSSGRGNDDGAYCRRIGIEGPLPTLKTLLETDRPDAVVSVRLHGALEAVLHGVPAFHLSYERKGFGAYADLGVPGWVVNAADFNAGQVAATLFAPDAAANFWHAASLGLAHLRRQRHTLVEVLRSTCAC
ncbi:polysaccharide pyruvyl transferase family protein [Paraburkholderia hayleyella]|uniref:polysaccharide pyruvyl transferase family protein n=1 Tax=Paraburkholderia hayleyella TaxID=2152889 RepID=UPI001291BED0|nr:polysaccharide pyruvyl transferase family protein [Paraburkholderia hayleyella]